MWTTLLVIPVSDMGKTVRIFAIVYLVQAALGAAAGLYLAVAYPDQVKAIFEQVTAKIEGR